MHRPALLSLALLLALPAQGQEAASGPLRVMAIGDSVTVGTGSTHAAGYRLTFWKRMQQAGVPVDMVGGKADGPEGFDDRHQGYNGATVYEVSGVVADKITDYRPDVVLLLIGSNDAHEANFSPHAFRVNLSVLLDRIEWGTRDARILVGTLPPNQYNSGERNKLHLNGILKHYVEERRAKGESIVLVDVFPALDGRRDMHDRLHPNDSGYEKIGDAFADALLSMLGSDVAG